MESFRLHGLGSASPRFLRANRGSLEHRTRHAEPTKRLQRGDGIVHLGTESCYRNADATLGKDFPNCERGDRCRPDRRADRRSEHDRIDAAVSPSSHLNSDSSIARFGMGATQHRQARRRPVTTSGTDARRDAASIGEHRLQEYWVDQSCPIAVDTADRPREPAQLPTGTANESFPPSVTPVKRLPAQCRVVLASTRRAGRADLGDMDLVDVVEDRCAVASEQTGKARRVSRAQDDPTILRNGERAKCKQAMYIVDIITHGNNVGAKPKCTGGGVHVTRRQRQHDNIRNDCFPRPMCQRSHRAGRRNELVGVERSRIVDDRSDVRRRQMTRHSGPHNAAPDDENGRTHACSAEIGAGKLAPAALLRWNASAATQPDKRRNQTGNAERHQQATQCLHVKRPSDRSKLRRKLPRGWGSMVGAHGSVPRGWG